MPIYASAGKKYNLCPVGLQQAVCCDVYDCGVLETTYKGEKKSAHKIDVYWQSADVNPEDGRPYLVRNRYTLSLHEKAMLRRDLESWRGRPFTKEEADKFDVETLIGVNCQLNITHREANGNVYANPTAIVPLGRGMAPLFVSKDFVRKKDRDVKPAGGFNDDAAGTEPPADPFNDQDPVPF